MPLRSISGINLESGRVETVSFETNSIPTGSPTGEDYFEKKGVDMIAIGDPKLMPQSSGLNCKFGTFALPVETSDWDNALASVVLAHATNLPSIQEPVKNTPEFFKMTVLLISEDGVLPKTFIFHTRAGNSGILQITGFTENPRGVKIRYKLVQNDAESKPAAAAPAFTLRWCAHLYEGDAVSSPFGTHVYTNVQTTLRVSKTWLLEPAMIDTVAWTAWNGKDKTLFLTLKNPADILALEKVTPGKTMAVVWQDEVVGIFPMSNPLGNGVWKSHWRCLTRTHPSWSAD